MPDTVIDEIDESTILALVVEDNERTRSATIDLLETHGITAVGAGTADQAVHEIKAAPGFDVIMTDINLRPAYYHDKSGLQVARMVRSVNSEVPLYGYSSHFSEEELTVDEWGVFSRYFPKAKSSVKASSLLDHVEDMRNQALKYREVRRKRALDRLEEFRQKYPTSTSDFATLRFLVPTRLLSSEPDPRSVEELLRRAGYRIRVIERGEQRPALTEERMTIVSPLMLWLKDVDGCTIAEVYGYPELYSYGEDDEEAIRNLMLLMDGFHRDFASSEGEVGESGALRRLREFLVDVFG